MPWLSACSSAVTMKRFDSRWSAGVRVPGRLRADAAGPEEALSTEAAPALVKIPWEKGDLTGHVFQGHHRGPLALMTATNMGHSAGASRVMSG